MKWHYMPISAYAVCFLGTNRSYSFTEKRESPRLG